MVVNSMSYATYERYKDSGVDWLGEIPSDWELEKAKWLFKKMERPVSPNDEIVTCFRDGQVTLRSNRRTEGFTNALKEHGYQGIRKGDLVIHQMDAFAGAIGISDSDGKSTPVYSACVPFNKNRVESKYYSYFLRNLAYLGFIESLAKGIRERSTDFRFSDFAKLMLPVPAISVQRKIVDFIDKNFAQIDQAIALKQQQIEKLSEYKQIVIQNAVTKGLNPNAPMKNSGVNWIGDIPEHWEVKKLKYLIDSKAGYAFPSQQFSQEGISVIRISELNINGSVDISNSPKLPFSFAKFLEEFCVVSGDILMAMTGGTIGKVSIYRENKKSLLNQRVCKFIVKASLDKKLFWHFCNSLYWKNYIDFKANGGAQPNISDNEIKKMYFPLPSISEQKTIANFLDEKTQNINQTIERYQTQIDRLKEYKNILINQAVTGKIKI